jgi:hemoglobin-like flavoprotein
MRRNELRLSEETIRLVRESAALLPANDPAPVHAFYDRLFELAPDVRPMFKASLDQQVRKLADMLGWIIVNLDDPGTMMTTLQQLGVRHKEYGVVVDHYAPVGLALIHMFQVTLGERFTPAMEEAWLEIYAVISRDMERGARQ